ncbi:MAG: PBECR4 domain-containing protein [Ruminococcus flavefaciens]|nr:PBECR4 domain-containing protein [Ruminococcus flavefaciens]
MISKKLLERLKECIQLYDKKCGKDYVVVFGKGKNDTLKYCHITFNIYNFWHLAGCKLDDGNHIEVYNQCKNSEEISDILEKISLVHSYSEAYTKCEIFERVFDFVSNAKCIKIGYVNKCPEEVYLTMALGNEIGIIGYDYPKFKKEFMIPKTVQEKKISSVSKELNKILFILSKDQSQKEYTHIEYEIKEGVVKEHFTRILDEIEISDSIS